MSMSFIAAGPLLVSTTRSCPFKDVALPVKLTVLCARNAPLDIKTTMPITAAVQPLVSFTFKMLRLCITPPYWAKK